MPATVAVGLQWGDEGKGKTTDLLSESVAMVVRYQGGDNAGHTIQGGLSRGDACDLVQRASLRAADERRPLAELLAADPGAAALSPAALAACFDDAAFLGHVDAVIARLDRLVPRADPATPGTRPTP